jgi:nucleotidyltransferase substrate binding protein (TIGR01987 family)
VEVALVGNIRYGQKVVDFLRVAGFLIFRLNVFERGSLTLDLSSLDKALLNLNRAVVRAQESPQDEDLRDATILRFEYCFELSWKMLKRRLELDVPTSASVYAMSFKELIREGFERGYIANPEEWFLFREHRNTVTHTYDEAKAKIVFDSAVKLNGVARALYSAIELRNKD